LAVHLDCLITALRNHVYPVVAVTTVFLSNVVSKFLRLTVFAQDNLKHSDQVTVAFVLLVHYFLVLTSEEFVSSAHLLLG